LGYEIFDRSGRLITINDVDQVVYRYAKEIFSLGCELQYAIKNHPLKHPIRIQIGIADLHSKMEVGYLEGAVKNNLQEQWIDE
jgi:LysR family transcriptional activator of nhaA